MYYKNDLKSAYLILEGEEGEEEDYQVAMMQENEIPGLLKAQTRFLDNCIHYYYDISGKTSFGLLHEKKQLSFEDMKSLVDALLATMRVIREYMLDDNCILLEPEWIFYHKDQFYFCYYPSSKRNIRVSFHELTEFFVREVDYQDEEGVRFAYTLHKSTMDENYSIEEILKELEPPPNEEETSVKEEVEVYELEEEEEEEEETEGFWKTIASLLKRMHL